MQQSKLLYMKPPLPSRPRLLQTGKEMATMNEKNIIGAHKTSTGGCISHKSAGRKKKRRKMCKDQMPTSISGNQLKLVTIYEDTKFVLQRAYSPTNIARHPMHAAYNASTGYRVMCKSSRLLQEKRSSLP